MTSYPNGMNISFIWSIDIHQISGSVEIAPILVDAIVILYLAEVLYLKIT
jgi:hypothetical protein